MEKLQADNIKRLDDKAILDADVAKHKKEND
jgi:hypothetical protein